jgi:hypothetical protein
MKPRLHVEQGPPFSEKVPFAQSTHLFEVESKNFPVVQVSHAEA